MWWRQRVIKWEFWTPTTVFCMTTLCCALAGLLVWCLKPYQFASLWIQALRLMIWHCALQGTTQKTMTSSHWISMYLSVCLFLYEARMHRFSKNLASVSNSSPQIGDMKKFCTEKPQREGATINFLSQQWPGTQDLYTPAVNS